MRLHAFYKAVLISHITMDFIGTDQIIITFEIGDNGFEG